MAYCYCCKVMLLVGVIALATLFSTTSASVGLNFRIPFPRESLSVNVNCTSGESFSVHGDDSHFWFVPIDEVEKCDAHHGYNYANSIVIYDADYDIGHFVYWLVKFDGFFKGYDNVTWVKEASWMR